MALTCHHRRRALLLARGQAWLTLEPQGSVLGRLRTPLLREKQLLLRRALAACDAALQVAVRCIDLEVDTESQLPGVVHPVLRDVRVTRATIGLFVELSK